MTYDFNDTKYYLKKRGEICNAADCGKCPLSKNNNGKKLACDRYEERFPEEAIAAVREWHESKTKKQQTYLNDFLSKFPNAVKDKNGYPRAICACNIYPEIFGRAEKCGDCGVCWDMEMEE